VACSGRVSPKSRGRKATKTSQRRNPEGSRHPAGPGRLRVPRLSAAHDAFIKPMASLTDPAQVPDAYSAEMMVSVLVGMVLQAGLDGDLLTSALLDVVDKLARGGLAHDYLGLRTLAVVGPSEISGTAARAAEGIAAAAERAGGAPAWAGQLGQVTPGACVVLADAYGETQTLLFEFAYAGGARAHQVWAVLDATWHGSVVALTIADEPGPARQLLDKQARRDGISVREIPAPEAGRRLQAGIDAFLRHGQPPGTGQKDDAYGDLCAALSVARHRAATLAGTADPQPAPVGVAALWPQDVRLRVAEEFLASPQGRELQSPAARKLPLLLIATCIGQLGCDPLATGPLLLERILLRVLPVTVTAPDRYGTEIPPFMRAWTRWLADRHALPQRHRRQLMVRLEFMLNRFAQLWADQSINPLRRYIQDQPDEIATVGELIVPILKRRTFAVARPEERNDGLVQARDGSHSRHASELDAADETDRRLITVLGLSARGLPRDRFDSYTAVTEQIWADNPPEVWAAAQRMWAAGQTRDAILGRLAGTWNKTAAQNADSYAAALARLAPPRSR
jgi:hypothetical protein